MKHYYKITGKDASKLIEAYAKLTVNQEAGEGIQHRIETFFKSVTEIPLEVRQASPSLSEVKTDTEEYFVSFEAEGSYAPVIKWLRTFLDVRFGLVQEVPFGGKIACYLMEHHCLVVAMAHGGEINGLTKTQLSAPKDKNVLKMKADVQEALAEKLINLEEATHLYAQIAGMEMAWSKED